jgi:hypothetical protein
LRKVAGILFLLIFSFACSVNKLKRESKIDQHAVGSSDSLYYYILNQNLTSRSFFIERAQFTIKSPNIDKSGIGTIKFQYPDKYLLSVKSNTGIEIFRILITNDSVQVNDRIDKSYLYGSSQFLRNKYGLTNALLPVLFGDYINDVKIKKSETGCLKGFVEIEGSVRNMDVRYNIDCRYAKSVAFESLENVFASKVSITYSDFFKLNGIYIPGLIKILDKQTNTEIGIKIEKVTSPWNGPLEFIPGRQYNKLPLL